MELEAGDKVKIKIGSMDIVTGDVMTHNMPYSESGTRRCIIQLIDEFDTKGKFNLPRWVERVKCVDSEGNIVWQGLKSSIADSVISGNSVPITHIPIPNNLEEKLSISKLSKGEFAVSDLSFGEAKPYKTEGTNYTEPYASNVNLNYKTEDGDYNIADPNAKTQVLSSHDRSADIGNLIITGWREVK